MNNSNNNNNSTYKRELTSVGELRPDVEPEPGDTNSSICPHHSKATVDPTHTWKMGRRRGPSMGGFMGPYTTQELGGKRCEHNTGQSPPPSEEIRSPRGQPNKKVARLKETQVSKRVTKSRRFRRQRKLSKKRTFFPAEASGRMRLLGRTREGRNQGPKSEARDHQIKKSTLQPSPVSVGLASPLNTPFLVCRGGKCTKLGSPLSN